jgi:DNA mismatch repair protein MutL
MSEAVTIPRISRLSAALASQIAAGEVIERPASVLKELVENSIDAGASRIEIDIAGGGTERLRVHDNGHGIHPDDMLLAMESHATSKIGSAEDLADIRSLGFRGEALASIAAVSEFELSSRIRAMGSGWRIRREAGGNAAPPVPAAHEPGTTVTVDNLFQPTPARRRFLRSPRTEFLHVMEMARRMALSQPELELVVRHNGKPVLHCRGGADYAARIAAVMGEVFSRRARRLDRRADGMRLWGWLGGQDLTRNQSDRQYFYLNGRMVRDKRINHAIRQALEEEIPAGRYPSFVLYLEIDPSLTDVNVHPTKQEVRFQKARDVHDFIHAAIRDIRVPAAVHNTGRDAAPTHSDRSSHALREAAMLYGGRADRPPATGPEMQWLTCLYGRFLLVQRGSRVLLIDAARVLRQDLERRLHKGVAEGGLARRPLLVPVMLECTAGETDAVDRNRPLLAVLGLELEPAGPASLRVAAIPALLREVDAQALVRTVLEVLAGPGEADPAELITQLAALGTPSLPMVSTGDMQAVTTALEAGGFNLDDKDCAGLWRTLDERDLAAWMSGHERR